MIGFRTVASSVGSPISPRSSTTGPASVADANALVPRNSGPQRTLDEVRGQVAQEVAVHAITRAKLFDGVKIGVRLVMSKTEDEYFLHQVAANIQLQLTLRNHLFAVGTTAQISGSEEGTVVICGSSSEFVQRAALIASSKFVGRVVNATTIDDQWVATILDLGSSSYDEDALWDVLAKATRPPVDPLEAPPGSKGIDQILSESRAKLQRISPTQAFDELRESQVGAPTFLVDIRPQAQREKDGGIHGSLIIERNVLEWRFDPRCAARLAIADRYDLRIIIFCQEGYTSSLAAYSLQQIGLLNATDIIGGYEAWKNAGLPVDIDSIERREPRSLVSLAGSVV